jgi:hypothetical protein
MRPHRLMSLFWMLVLIGIAIWLLRKASSPSPPVDRRHQPDGRTMTLERKSSKPTAGTSGTGSGQSEFVIGDDAATSGYRIPPRSSRPRQGNGSNPSSPRWEVTFDTPGSRFLNDARKFVDHKHAEIEPVPLKAYWTTYDDLDQNQARWYFYLRSRAREREVIQTDLSYLFIHIYECLHQVGFDSPQQALDHLIWLWKGYRSQYPSLDRYLQNWALEMIPYYGIDADPVQLTWELMIDGVAFHNRHLARAAWLKEKEFDRITMPVLASLFGFDPRTGKFFKEHEDQAAITGHFQHAFRVLDRYFSEREGAGLFESIRLNREHVVKGEAFSGAVFELERRQVVVARVPAFSESEKTQALLEGSLKLAENVLRKKVGFGGSRRGIELPADLEAYLKDSLERSRLPEKEKPRREITIDLGKVRGLEQESHEIRKRLIGTDVQPRPVSSRFRLPLETPAGHLTDVDQVAELLDQLELAELRLMHVLRSNDWELRDELVANPTTITSVNRHSHTYLGEDLLAREADSVLVTDDYRDELEFLLPRVEYSVVEPEAAPAVNGLDEWVALKEHLTALHIQVLRRVCEGCGQAELESFAAEHFYMGSVLLGEINEKAVETIGDVIIDAQAEPLLVHEEHLGSVKALLA